MSFKVVDGVPFSYTSKGIPATYKCSKCKSTNCKLWREYNTFLDNQVLYCSICAGRNQKRDVSSITPEGKINWYFKGNNFGLTDQIGNLIPAVPTEQNDTFWGYTSVPEEGCIWWKNLPSKPK